MVKETENQMVLPGAEGEENGQLLLNWHSISVLQNRVPEMHGGDEYLMPMNCTLKMVN